MLELQHIVFPYQFFSYTVSRVLTIAMIFDAMVLTAVLIWSFGWQKKTREQMADEKINLCEQKLLDTQTLIKQKEEENQLMSEAVLREFEEIQHYLETGITNILLEMEKFEEGDLTVKIQPKEQDNIGRLYTGFNNAVANIHTLIQNITYISQENLAAISVISSETEQLSQGIESYTQQADDITVAVEQTVEAISDTARQVTLVAREATQAQREAIAGGDIMQELALGIGAIAQKVSHATDTILELRANSDAIGEITGMIDSIADQTNLLALNAAIEAARAGEHGRGFAVVADEVRKLAERTQIATKEISTSIRAIQQQTHSVVEEMVAGQLEVTKGQQSAEKGQEHLSRIINRVNKVSEVVTHIASVTEEQASAMASIGKGINIITSNTSQSSSTIHQTFIGIQNLQALAERLNEATAQFHTGHLRMLNLSSGKTFEISKHSQNLMN
jgi:methyl-accepting chemotaxis protein